MAFTIIEHRLGLPQIATTVSASSIGALKLSGAPYVGTVVRGDDPTYGEGEFIFLQGVGSTVVGSLVTYNTLTGATTLSPNTANLAQPVAVAMAATNATTLYGWYQIGGSAVIKKVAIKVNPNVAMYLSSTAGRLTSTQSAGKQILGLRTINAATVASATSTITVVLDRPHAQGQIT